MPSQLKRKTKAKPGDTKRPRRATGLTKTTSNGRAKTGLPRHKLTNAGLRKLAAKNRPPQSWYDDEQNLF